MSNELFKTLLEAANEVTGLVQNLSEDYLTTGAVYVSMHDQVVWFEVMDQDNGKRFWVAPSYSGIPWMGVTISMKHPSEA